MQVATNDFTAVNPLLSALDAQEQAMFRSIWILKESISSLKIVVNEDERTAARCLLKLSLHSADALQHELFALCSRLCRNITGFAKEFAASEESDCLVQPERAGLIESFPLVAYILALNEKFTAQACLFARHLNTILAGALEKGQCTTQNRQAVGNLWILVKNKAIRESFREAGGLRNIMRIVSTFCLNDQITLNQTLYESLCICWVSLYDTQSVPLAYANQVIPITHSVLKKNTKEKCIRMSLQILEVLLWQQTRDRSLDTKLASTLSYSPGSNGLRLYIDMANSGMLKTFQGLQKKNWEDIDITEKLQALEHALLGKIESMTTFSEYRGEVQCGVLQWTPIHTNVKFWKDNVRQFEANEFEILASLRDIMANVESDTSIAVACHDIGEVLRHHPQGRKLLSIPALSGVKERILDLMKHSSAEVRRHALLAIQKIMVQKWEFIG